MANELSRPIPANGDGSSTCSRGRGRTKVKDRVVLLTKLFLTQSHASLRQGTAAHLATSLRRRGDPRVRGLVIGLQLHIGGVEIERKRNAGVDYSLSVVAPLEVV